MSSPQKSAFSTLFFFAFNQKAREAAREICALGDGAIAKKKDWENRNGLSA